ETGRGMQKDYRRNMRAKLRKVAARDLDVHDVHFCLWDTRGRRQKDYRQKNRRGRRRGTPQNFASNRRAEEARRRISVSHLSVCNFSARNPSSMPIRVLRPVRRLSQDEFAETAYSVMGCV